MVVICLCVIGYIVFQVNVIQQLFFFFFSSVSFFFHQCLQLAKLDPESKGFLLSLIVGILLVVMLTILIVTGLWGTFTKNDRMVHSFAFVCRQLGLHLCVGGDPVHLGRGGVFAVQQRGHCQHVHRLHGGSV
jgi:hypothetical protein